MCVDCVLCCVLQDRWTALYFAARYKKPEAVKVLLDYGADMTLQDKVSSE